MKRQRRTLNSYCQVKEASFKKLPIIMILTIGHYRKRQNYGCVGTFYYVFPNPHKIHHQDKP